MDAPSARLMKLSSRRSARSPEMPRMGSDHHGSSYSDKSEGKKKGRPRVEGQELRDIPAQMMVRWKDEFKSRSRVKCPSPGCWLEFPSVYGLKYHYQRCQGSMAVAAEKLSHACPHCEAVFATKVRLQKHKLWNHPERAPPRPESEATHQRSIVKGSAKKRPTENSPPPPALLKVRRRSHKVTRPAHNGACAQRPATPSDSGGSESDEDSLPPPFPEEDPERMKHRRKQKTPKKFTGEQPSISGTFGLKGMNKVEEKLKAGRMKRAESLLTDESQRKSSLSTAARKEPATICSAPPADGQWHGSERAEVVCPTCSVVTRKTVSGLKKHMEICKKLRDALRCQQCHKQFRSKAGLNYHATTDHLKASAGEHVSGEEQVERERLGRALKQACTISCPNQGCSADSQFHQRRCGGGGEPRDSDKPVFLCQHCGKTYRSKTGRDYHLRAEHPLASLEYWNREEIREAEEVEEEREEHLLKESEEELVGKNEDKDKADQLLDLDRTPSGRVRRRSAQVAVFHLQEIAEDELAKDWGNKRRIKDDLVPDIKRLNYTRPGLPNFSSETMDGWKSQVKEKGFICCPNCNCEAIYSSVSGLKAHLANCNKGGGDVGKYTCLLCHKEFNSESGVKYHISKTHSQNWFRTSVNDASNNKKKDPEPDSNGLQDVKHEAPGKKRGRKPKDPPTETLSVLTDTPTFSSTPPLTHTPSADTQELHPICHASPTRPAPESSGSPTHTRDRKRVKARRAFSDE